jgi:hypothetical protein
MGAEGFDVGGMKDEMDFTTKTRSFQLLHTRARPSSRHFRTTFLPAFRIKSQIIFSITIINLTDLTSLS